MICQRCPGETVVTDSRPNLANTIIRRRRRCTACGFRFSTNESAFEVKKFKSLRSEIIAIIKKLDDMEMREGPDEVS